MIHAPAKPTLVLLAGMPGTGKSTLATALARRLGWPVIDKDLLNTVLLAAALTQAQAGPLAYELALTLAHALVVQQGQSVMLDTAGRQPFILQRARTIAQEAGGQLKVVRCIAPFAVRQARLQARQASLSQWTHDQTTLDQETAWYAHLPADTLIVSSDQPIEDLLAIVLPFVQAYESAQC
jgi:predicted kinase